MITINLLPESLKRKKPQVNVKAIPFLPILFLCAAIVILIHLLLGVAGIYKRIQAISLNRRWHEAQPKIKEIEQLRADLRKKEQAASVLSGVVKRDFYWSALLDKINKAVPQGLWLSKVSINKDNFIMEGSVFNFGLDEIVLLNNFFNDLKEDGFFKANFDNFDLTSVRRRKIKDYEVVDFLLSANLKEDKVVTKN